MECAAGRRPGTSHTCRAVPRGSILGRFSPSRYFASGFLRRRVPSPSPRWKRLHWRPLGWCRIFGYCSEPEACDEDQTVFSQGGPADAVFYIQKGKIKITVISEHGKEAVVALLGTGDFCGEGCLAGQPLRMSTAVAMTECVATRLEKAAIIRTLHDEPAFSEMFLSYVLSRIIRVEEDLVDQDRKSTRLNSS